MRLSSREWGFGDRVAVLLHGTMADSRAEPSAYLSREDAAGLAARGFEVRSIAGAGHTVWFGFVEEFMAALDGWIQAP
jgi:hypothetical protein